MADRSAAKSKTNAYANFDVNDKYKSGQWGHGSLSQEQLGEKYGLDTTAAANKGDTAVWGTNRGGERVFLGNIDNSQRSNDDVIKAHLAQADSGESKHGNVPESVSSDGDVIGAMLNMWDGGEAAAPVVEEKPKEDTSKPASNTLTKAQSYTEAYDDFRVSGGAVNQMAGDLGARDKFMDNYKFNVKKRMEPGVANKTGNDNLNATVPQNVLGKPSDYAVRRTQEREDLTNSYAQKNKKVSTIANDIVGKGAGFYSV